MQEAVLFVCCITVFYKILLTPFAEILSIISDSSQMWEKRECKRLCWFWEETKKEAGSLHWTSAEYLCWDWWMILTSAPTWPVSPFSPGGPGIPWKITYSMRSAKQCRIQIWNQGEWITCSPSGPGKPLSPLCPSSPLAPFMPCWPRGPGSPSAPYNSTRCEHPQKWITINWLVLQ